MSHAHADANELLQEMLHELLRKPVKIEPSDFLVRYFYYLFKLTYVAENKVNLVNDGLLFVLNPKPE